MGTRTTWAPCPCESTPPGAAGHGDTGSPDRAVRALLPWLFPPPAEDDQPVARKARTLLEGNGRDPGGLVLGIGEFLYLPSERERAAAAGPTCVDRVPLEPLPASALGSGFLDSVKGATKRRDRGRGTAVGSGIRLASGVPAPRTPSGGPSDA
jgi:hypothetical protein